jgi:hypothetical protein
MQVRACDIEAGDYIQDLGVVEEVRLFGGIVADNLKTSPQQDGLNWVETVCAELDACHSHAYDRVVVVSSGKERSFMGDALVEVVRFVPLRLVEAA